MQIKLNTTKLKEMVSKAIKGASLNKMIPLTGLMSIKLFNHNLILITTDATNYLYIRECGIEGEDFEIVVGVDVFSKLISKLTCETVTLTVDGDKLTVIGNGRYAIELPVDENGNLIKYPDPLAEFENSPEMRPSTEINLSTIKLILATNKAALATTLEVPCYTGYYVADKVVSTDNYKICATKIPIFDEPVLLNPEMVNLLDVMTADKVLCVRDGNKIVFKSPDCVVYGTDLSGIEDFAIDAISGLVDEPFESCCKVSKNQFLGVLDRLALFVGDYDRNEITLIFSEEGILCTNKQATGNELIKYLDSQNYREYTCTVDIVMLTSQVKAQQSDSVEIWYGKPNAIKMVDGNVIQIVALSEEE